MADNNGQIFPVNSLREDPNLRNDYPLVKFAVDLAATALVSGTKTWADNASPFAATADIIGVELYTNQDAATKIYGATASIEADGLLDIVVSSSLTSDTTSISGVAFVLGRIAPTNV